MPKATSSAQISVAHDIIAIKNAASLMAAQFHGYAFRNARSDHVPDGRSPEVVRNTARAPGRRPSPPPDLVEAVSGNAVARPVGTAPAGYRYGIIDGDLVKLAVGTMLVVDAIEGLVR